MKILMTGATGLVGKKIGFELVRNGHQVVVISRQSEIAVKSLLPFPCEVIVGDLNRGPIEASQFDAIEGVIHLMGEPVAQKKSSEDIKAKIKNSRIVTTQNLIRSLKQCHVFISTSAIGIFGDRADEELTEESQIEAKDFLSQVCVEWELEALKVVEKFKNCRCVIPRVGLVLAAEGGALEKMLFPFRCGVGGALGRGQQWMSWIHIQDLVQIYVHALENKQINGIFNAVSPEPVRNLAFSKSLAKGLFRPLGPSIPQFVVKMIFGEMSAVILGSQKVNSKKIQALGFQFSYPNLDKAFENILQSFQPHQGGTREDVFYAEQFLPIPKEQVFPFFSKAENLEKITPQILNFRIKKKSTEQIQEGTLIDYRLKIHGIPARWRTRIEAWRPPYQFVDTQLQGPYSLWHHTHDFEDFAGGTLMRDKVRFRLPFGFLGWLGGFHFVKSDVTKIFEYRRKVVSEIDWSKEV